MFRILAGIEYQKIAAFVIQSEQLGPGVGGYRPSSLVDLKERIEGHRGVFYLATACRCHGVVSGGIFKGDKDFPGAGP